MHSALLQEAGRKGRSQKTGNVQGIVVDNNGKPVQEAQVSAIQVIGRPHTREKQRTRTGKDGKFRFSVLPDKRLTGSD